jgi:glutaconate CoA-transferase subunit B
VVTDFGVLRPGAGTEELELVARYAHVTAEEAIRATGWPLRIADELTVIEPPTAIELATLRDLHARTRAAHSRPVSLPAAKGAS